MEYQLPVLGTNGFPLQDAAVYGPIHSRRYGHSLGINPLPVSYKFCDFDCVYCQYGWTPRTLTRSAAKTEESSAPTGLRAPRPGNSVQKTDEKLKRLPDLLSEIKVSFQKMIAEKTPVDVITIAGNGEPTIYPQFLEFVKGLLKLRDEYYPGVNIGILSDASQCHRPEIKEALELLDERCMKLDGGDPETIRAINKPTHGFDFSRMLKALKELREITIQSLFVQGSCDNTNPRQVEHWAEEISFIRPQAVQVYTIDRPPADSGIEAVPMVRLREIAKFCKKMTGITAEVFD